jgi:hypothetical protein
VIMNFQLNGLSPVRAGDLPKGIVNPILKDYPNALFMLDTNEEIIVCLGTTKDGRDV